jgi:hypothetical protein
MAGFNDAVLQALADLADGQRAMREEMNDHFGKLNGRLRHAESTLDRSSSHGPRLEILETQVADHTKQIAKVKTVVATAAGSATSAWAVLTNWESVKTLLHKVF